MGGASATPPTPPFAYCHPDRQFFGTPHEPKYGLCNRFRDSIFLHSQKTCHLRGTSSIRFAPPFGFGGGPEMPDHRAAVGSRLGVGRGASA